MLIWVLGLTLAGLVGLSMGLLGGGGSVLAVPILVYVMGVEPKPAIAMTLVIVGVVSLVGALYHWRAGNINIKTAVKFGLAMMPGSYLGAKLAGLPFITGTVQMILLAGVMLVAAGFMIYRSYNGPLPENDIIDFYPRPFCRRCGLWLATEGLGVGLLTGLVGVGGGFAIVPALVLLGNTPVREAIGTSLLVIAISSGAAFSGYVGQVNLDVHLMGYFTVIAGAGALAGALLTRYLRPMQLQRNFAYFLALVAAFILFQHRPGLDIGVHPPQRAAVTHLGDEWTDAQHFPHGRERIHEQVSWRQT